VGPGQKGSHSTGNFRLNLYLTTTNVREEIDYMEFQFAKYMRAEGKKGEGPIHSRKGKKLCPGSRKIKYLGRESLGLEAAFVITKKFGRVPGKEKKSEAINYVLKESATRDVYLPSGHGKKKDLVDRNLGALLRGRGQRGNPGGAYSLRGGKHQSFGIRTRNQV